jgi:hypothetical protein
MGAGVSVTPCTSDLAVWKPDVARNLTALLEYDKPDFEDVFCLTFTLSYEVVCGRCTGWRSAGGLPAPVQRRVCACLGVCALPPACPWVAAPEGK